MPGTPLAFRDAPAWFGLATQRIDALEGVEDRLTADLVAAAGAVRARADRMLTLWAAGGLILFALSAGLAAWLGTGIARPLARIARVLTAIGRDEDGREPGGRETGTTDLAIPAGGPREVRAIAAAAVAFRDSVAERRAARAAQERGAAETAAARRAAALDLADSFVAEITGPTEASVRSIGGITEVIRTLARIGAEIAAEIAAMVEQQGAATAEMARTTAQTSHDTSGVSKHMAGVGAAAGTASQGSAQVLRAAAGLSRQAGDLRGVVDHFLARVRAA
jgi:hypothetical protein